MLRNLRIPPSAPPHLWALAGWDPTRLDPRAAWAPPRARGSRTWGSPVPSSALMLIGPPRPVFCCLAASPHGSPALSLESPARYEGSSRIQTPCMGECLGLVSSHLGPWMEHQRAEGFSNQTSRIPVFCVLFLSVKTHVRTL